jgi:hypothetical protein
MAPSPAGWVNVWRAYGADQEKSSMWVASSGQAGRRDRLKVCPTGEHVKVCWGGAEIDPRLREIPV